MILAPNLGKLLETCVLIMNAAAILNEKYFLRKCKCAIAVTPTFVFKFIHKSEKLTS